VTTHHLTTARTKQQYISFTSIWLGKNGVGGMNPSRQAKILASRTAKIQHSYGRPVRKAAPPWRNPVRCAPDHPRIKTAYTSSCSLVTMFFGFPLYSLQSSDPGILVLDAIGGSYQYMETVEALPSLPIMDMLISKSQFRLKK
jgi:hypothetical protein